MKEFEATERGYFKVDLARYPKHSWITQPSLIAIGVYRMGRRMKVWPPGVRQVATVVYYFAYFWARLITGIDIPRSARIGPGLMIHHFGGIIVNPLAKVGSHFTMRQGVTIGSRREGDDVPTIGNRVTVGAYAQILGDIVIGDDVVVGALSLVISNVSPHLTVYGIPAGPKT